MPTIPSITLAPGAEFDFTNDEPTVIAGHTPGEWSGDAVYDTFLNSEAWGPADVVIPVDIYLAHCQISNLAVTGPFKIYAAGSCTDGGGNNANVIFLKGKVLAGGVWQDVLERWILVGGVWVSVIEAQVLKSGFWKSC